MRMAATLGIRQTESEELLDVEVERLHGRILKGGRRPEHRHAARLAHNLELLAKVGEVLRNASVQAISCSLCSSNQLLAPSLLPHARCTLDPTSAHTCATQTHYHNTQLTQNLFTHEQHRLIVSATTDSSPLPSHPPPLLPLCSKRICTVSAREKQGRASERARARQGGRPRRQAHSRNAGDWSRDHD